MLGFGLLLCAPYPLRILWDLLAGRGVPGFSTQFVTPLCWGLTFILAASYGLILGEEKVARLDRWLSSGLSIEGLDMSEETVDMLTRLAPALLLALFAIFFMTTLGQHGSYP